MRKREVGVKKDYRKMYEELQRGLRGQPDWLRRASYKDFYKTIAKAADQRLVNLESLAQKKGYKDVTGWAYAKAQRDIRGMFGENATRFNRKIPENLNSVYKDINRVLDFLESPTSSKSGIDEVYNKRASTINERYGTSVDWSTVGGLYESKLWKKTNSKHGSKTVLKAIGEIQLNKSQIIKALNEHKPIRVIVREEYNPITGKYEKNKKVQEEVNKLLRYYKKDVDSLLKKLPKSK